MCCTLQMEVIRTINAQGDTVLNYHGQIVVKRGDDFRAHELAIASGLNQLGLALTRDLLLRLDTEGEALVSECIKLTTKGQLKLVVETPYGPFPLVRHVYQSSKGGATRAPLDERAGLVGNSTPRLAFMVASKAAEMPAAVVARDLEENHLRKASPSFIQDLACAVSTLAREHAVVSPWVPECDPALVARITVGMDGAMINTPHDGWRQALCATFTLYNKDGERLETNYIGCGPGATPPEGKAVFFSEAGEVLARLKRWCPGAAVLGISDAASDLQAWLGSHTEDQLIDFHHAAEYLSKAAPAFVSGGTPPQEWASAMRRTLRDEPGAAANIAADLTERLESHAVNRLSASQKADLSAAESYFRNHHEKMDYASWTAQKRAIGSGPTEAACKTIIKQRMTQSGMRWSVATAHEIISLRALVRTPARWKAFWTVLASQQAATAL